MKITSAFVIDLVAVYSSAASIVVASVPYYNTYYHHHYFITHCDRYHYHHRYLVADLVDLDFDFDHLDFEIVVACSTFIENLVGSSYEGTMQDILAYVVET